MADNYTIYLVNKSAGDQIFWCFLEEPKELAGQAGIFANSAASLAVIPNYPGDNYFTIPAQFVVGAGASNNAVGLNVRVTSALTQNANLTDQFSAEYATAPPNKGPNMTLIGNGAAPTQISIASNGFNQANNENLGWFSNMSFGINTAAGFMGMTWSPFPSQTRTLTPILNFYVAVGSYGANTLAAYTTVSNKSAHLTTPRDFLRNGQAEGLTVRGGGYDYGFPGGCPPVPGPGSRRSDHARRGERSAVKIPARRASRARGARRARGQGGICPVEGQLCPGRRSGCHANLLGRHTDSRYGPPRVLYLLRLERSQVSNYQGSGRRHDNRLQLLGRAGRQSDQRSFHRRRSNSSWPPVNMPGSGPHGRG